jgi:hypothetical protein
LRRASGDRARWASGRRLPHTARDGGGEASHLGVAALSLGWARPMCRVAGQAAARHAGRAGCSAFRYGAKTTARGVPAPGRPQRRTSRSFVGVTMPSRHGPGDVLAAAPGTPPWLLITVSTRSTVPLSYILIQSSSNPPTLRGERAFALAGPQIGPAPAGSYRGLATEHQATSLRSWLGP